MGGRKMRVKIVTVGPYEFKLYFHLYHCDDKLNRLDLIEVTDV